MNPIALPQSNVAHLSEIRGLVMHRLIGESPHRGKPFDSSKGRKALQTMLRPKHRFVGGRDEPIDSANARKRRHNKGNEWGFANSLPSAGMFDFCRAGM